MVVVGTKYDKELNSKIFYVREVVSYSHSTSTSLTVTYTDGVFHLTATVSNLIGKGYVEFYKDGVKIGEQYVGQTASLLYKGTDEPCVFLAKFMGNSDCLKSQSPEVNYVSKIVPEFTLSSDKSDYYVGDAVKITPVLPSDATGEIVYTVKGSKYTREIGNVFSYNFNQSGEFEVKATYTGDDKYSSVDASVLISVSKIPLTLNTVFSKSQISVGESNTLTVTVKDYNDVGVGGLEIYNNSTLLGVTGNDGVLTKTFTYDKTGSVEYLIKCVGDAEVYVLPEDVSMTVFVGKVDVELSASSDKSAYHYGGAVKVTGVLKDKLSYVLDGAVVDVGGKTVTTDMGEFEATLTCDSIGVKSITVSFDGDDRHNGKSVYVGWNGFKADTLLTVASDKSECNVGEQIIVAGRLTDEFNNPMKQALVSVDGVACTTNNLGDFSKTINMNSGGVKTLTIKYGGGEYYNSTSKTLTVTVIENTPQLVLTGESLIGEVGDDLSLSCQTNLANGATVNLVRGEDVVATSIVGADGVVSLAYICEGYGDVEVKAEYMNGSNVYYSNVLNIEDCIIYEPYTEEFNNQYTVPDGMGYSFSEKGILVTGSNQLLNCNVPLTGPFVAEVTFNGHGTGDYFKPINIFEESSDGVINNPNQKVAFVAFNQNLYIYGNTKKGQTTGYYNYSAGTTAKVIITTGSVSTYYNNVLIRSDSFTDLFNSPYYYGIFINTDGKNGYVKDLKIKPYTE